MISQGSNTRPQPQSHTNQPQRLVKLGGIELPHRTVTTQTHPHPHAPTPLPTNSIPSRLIPVTNTASHLHSIALGICEHRPILLEGPAGCGKSLLIDECARVLGYDHDLVRLHLDDQMDSKTLLGTYTCTDIPGEFRWSPGALTQAVCEGRWVVIEDIDRCPFEILSAIISLLERGELYLAGRGDIIKADPGFQLFATKTVLSASSTIMTESTPLLHALFSRIYIDALTYQELFEIVTKCLQVSLPQVPATLVQRILTAFTSFVLIPVGNDTSSSSSSSTAAPSLLPPAALSTGRKYSTRDLLKWCERIRSVLLRTGFNSHGDNDHLTQTMMEEIWLGALDIFVAPIPTPIAQFTAAIAAQTTVSINSSTSVTAPVESNPRQRVIHHLAHLWQIDPDRLNYFLQAYRPKLDTSSSSQVTIGRVTLTRSLMKQDKSSSLATALSIANFAHTKYSLRLMEHLCMSVFLAEPVLLVSDTGCGKTTTIQYLANLVGKKLHVQNLNQQSDSADLIGGYKPVEVSKLLVPIMNSFGILFPKTFSRNQNASFLLKLRQAFEEKQWTNLVRMMNQTVEMAERKLTQTNQSNDPTDLTERERERATEPVNQRKQAKTVAISSASNTTPTNLPLLDQWSIFSHQLTHFSHQLTQLSSSFVFHFNEGSLVTAIKNGDWILLDEINLASSETLERLSGILEGSTGSLAITERGDSNQLIRHPDFRLFAAMNPATDAGKKNLPPSIRTRFTELYLDEMTDRDDLAVVIKQYLEPTQSTPLTDGPIPYDGLVNFYLQARSMSTIGLIQEGSNNNPAASNSKPHYSLRTLCRSLQFTKDIMHLYAFDFNRALYEGLVMSFCTLLTPDSSLKLQELMMKSLQFTRSMLNLDHVPRKPSMGEQTYQLIGESFWLSCGPEPIHESLTAKFIPTASVRSRLKQLSRAMLTGKYPILLQGPTAGGKTSLVEYLALKTGHKFVRINNHEHTDLQEYLGSYVTDPQTGKLIFQEGVLVDAVRSGHWIVLDELNLAPSEVLEALNRLLDDNRELFLPETQETIKPHPHFLLFATQNPSGGIYGGRKVLSKAFRNRFITLHIDDLPENEIEEILHKRCRLPPKFCQAMIGTMTTLATRREKTNVFAGKRSFMTPRDLFRWGERSPTSYQQLAEDGFMLLGERLRTEDAKALVKEVLEKQCKVKIDEEKLYSQPAVDTLIKELLARMHPEASSEILALLDPTSYVNANNKEAQQIGKIAWTYNMRRLFIQVGRCLLFEEPVLLVGETGSGKTTVCQLFSLVLKQLLRVINCHQHTESSDFLGGLRPVRGKERTAAELRASIREWFDLYQQAQLAAAVDSPIHPPINQESKHNDLMVIDETSSTNLTPGLPTLSSEALATLSTIDCTASITDLMQIFNEYSSTVLSFERRFQSSLKSYQQQLSIEREQRSQEKKLQKKKTKKARKADADMDVEMDDATNESATQQVTLPTAPINPIPPSIWSSLLPLTSRITGLNTRFQSLFEWVDGALVQSLRGGDLLLIDEISLAEDAVLERLNSVLEPSRTLFLAEKGGRVPDVIKAAPNFRVFATMNPGGDFGKKELSPALRNRFTEIWVPPFSNKEDLLRIITERMTSSTLFPYANSILEFVQWFNRNNKPNSTGGNGSTTANTPTSVINSVPTVVSKSIGPTGSKRYLSLRDILGWVGFMNQCIQLHIKTGSSMIMTGFEAYLHGSCLTVLDGLGIGSTDSDTQISHLKQLCIDKLLDVLPDTDRSHLNNNHDQTSMIKRNLLSPSSANDTILSNSTHFGISPFIIPKGPFLQPTHVQYALRAKTTQMNLLRVLRSLTLPKAILLEGPPGVGKTSLLTTLAAASGHKIVRINLSEQTDMMDLLGMDLPVPGGSGGEFAWCDGIFLQALKAGDWVLLDELNLASQSVLEGLNAVLDHRAQVFIPELDATFDCPSTFRIFACQNPMSQGGGRKGLPASFLNRFTKVYLNSLEEEDLKFISATLNPHIPEKIMTNMITFNSRIQYETMVTRKIGRKGYPWEFNLRDVFKLCELIRKEQEKPDCIQGTNMSHSPASHSPNPGKYLDLIYLQRMRTQEDRTKIIQIYRDIFDPTHDQTQNDQTTPSHSSTPLVIEPYPTFQLSETFVQIGSAFLPRRTDILSTQPTHTNSTSSPPLLILQQLLSPLAHLATCIQHNFPPILIGGTSTGKTSLVRLLAELTRNNLHEVLMTSGIDSSELLGCFEQVDLTRHKKLLWKKVTQLVEFVIHQLKSQQDHTKSNSAELTLGLLSDQTKTNTTNKSTKRLRDGQLTPTNTTDTSTHTQPHNNTSPSVSTSESLERSWSLLQLAMDHHSHDPTHPTPHHTSSLLSEADDDESAQQLSTVAFSHEQFTLLQSILNSIQPVLTHLSTTHSLTIPPHLLPSNLLTQAGYIQSLGAASNGRVIGNFEWIDGSLITALEQGDWILLDNVNFCNPSVLDRLNPLLEMDGVLLVNECGLVDGAARIIKPHPNFRMILAMDSRYGDISRAMRNRCLEICLLQPIGVDSTPLTKPIASNTTTTTTTTGALTTVAATNISPGHHDLVSLVNSYGMVGQAIPDFMISIHSHLTHSIITGSQHQQLHASGANQSSLKSLSIRNLKRWSLLCAQQLSLDTNSTNLFDQLWSTFTHAYNLSIVNSTGLDRFSDGLRQFFHQQFESKISSSSSSHTIPALLLSPTVWPTHSHTIRAHGSQRRIEIEGSVLKYLTYFSLGQTAMMAGNQSDRKEMLREFIRELNSQHSNQTSIVPARLWKLMNGLSSQTILIKSDDEPMSIPPPTAASSTDGIDLAHPISLMDQPYLLPASSLTPTFTPSHHPLQPHPTTIELFHLSAIAFIQYSNTSDYQERIQWLRQQLSDLTLLQQLNQTGGSSTSPTMNPSAGHDCSHRLQIELNLISHTLTAIYQHPRVIQYSHRMSEIVEACGFNSSVFYSGLNPYMDPGFLDLLRTNATPATQFELSRLLIEWEFIRLLIDSTYHTAYESHIYEGVSLLLSQPTQLSLLELSYGCYTNQIQSQRLSTMIPGMDTEFILQLYPFWSSLQLLEKNLLDYGIQATQHTTSINDTHSVESYQNSLDQLIRDKNYFWLTIYSTKKWLTSSSSTSMGGKNSSLVDVSAPIDMLLTKIHIHWKGLTKRIKEVAAFIPGLVTPVADRPMSTSLSPPPSTLIDSYQHFQTFFIRLQSVLQGTDHASTTLIGVKNTLWKNGGHPRLPRSKELEAIEIGLQEIERQILYRPPTNSSSTHSTGTQPFFIVDHQFKNDLLGAMADLKYLYLRDQSLDEINPDELKEYHIFLKRLSSKPTELKKRLQRLIELDQTQLNTRQLLLRIRGDGEESLEDLGLITHADSQPHQTPSQLHRSSDIGVDADADLAPSSSQFLSITAGASKSSSKWLEQSAHDKSLILPPLLPIFDLGYLEYSKLVLVHVRLIGYLANEISHQLTQFKNNATTQSTRVNNFVNQFHSLIVSFHHRLSSLLIFLPAILQFYGSRTSAISGLLDLQPLKALELISESLIELVDEALMNHSTEPTDSHQNKFMTQLLGTNFSTLLNHLPSIIQEIQYHFSNFELQFLQLNHTTINRLTSNSHPSASNSSDSNGLNSSVLLTPIKSLLVLELISSSMDINLIHRQSQRIQLQLLGEYLTRDLIPPAQTQLSLVNSIESTPHSVHTTHTTIIDCVSLLTTFHGVVTCFHSYFPSTTDFDRVRLFINALIQVLLTPNSHLPLVVPKTVPTDVYQSLMTVRDPRLHSLLPTLVIPFLNTMLHMVTRLSYQLTNSSSANHHTNLNDSNCSTVFHVGHLTFLLSLLRFYLLLPVSPVDSNQKYFILLQNATYFQSSNRTKLELLQWQESLMTGRSHSHDINHLQANFASYQQLMTSLRKKVTYRRYQPDHTKPFHQLFHELRRFTNTFLDIQKLRTQFIQPMIQTVAAPPQHPSVQMDHEVTTRLSDELNSFQTNSAEFITRVQVTFSEYPDFIVPLLTALHQLRHGLSLMQYSWSERIQQNQLASTSTTTTPGDKNALVYETIRSLVCFPFGPVSNDHTHTARPSIGLISPLHHLTHQKILANIDSLCRSAVTIMKEENHMNRAAAREAAEMSDISMNTDAHQISERASLIHNTAPFYSARLNLLTTVLKRIQLFSRVSGRLTPDLLRILDALFKSFVSIFKSNRELEAKREADEKELYKYKEQKEEVRSEEERDQAELQRLFPDYSHQFDDILGSSDAPLMDEEVEAQQRRQQQHQAKQLELSQQAEESNHDYGILTLTPEHQTMIYQAFTEIFSIQKSSLMTSAVTANPNLTDQDTQAYIQSYQESYQVGTTLVQALSKQGQLTNSSIIPSTSQFESEFKSGHLFMICKSLSDLDMTSSTSEREVNAIMESFINDTAGGEPTDSNHGGLGITTGGITLNPLDATRVDSDSAARFEVDPTELEEGFKMDGKTGLKESDTLATRIASSKNSSSKIDWTKFPDMHHEPDMIEYRKLETPLTAFMTRIRELLTLYNNNPILSQLIQLGHRLMNLDISTPLAKVLAGVEKLLEKSEEWEKYAVRHVSIKKQLIDLFTLVARWRKRELYTWPKALHAKKQYCHQQALKRWFQLYDIIHTTDEGISTYSPPGNTDEEVTRRCFLQQIYETFDDIIQRSTLGDIDTNMSILLGFYQQINLEIVEGFGLDQHQQSLTSPRMALSLRIRIQQVLLNLYQYYEQFLPEVDRLIQAKKAPIEKSLRDQVRLAKWDISNFWSLRDSSQKSHRKLLKFSKDYDEVLKIKFSSILMTEDERDAKETDDTVAFGPVGGELNDAKKERERLLKRLRKEVEKSKKKNIKKKQSTQAGIDSTIDANNDLPPTDDEFDLPSLAHGLVKVLPDAAAYLSDQSIYQDWFKSLSIDSSNSMVDVNQSSIQVNTADVSALVTSQTRLPSFYSKMVKLSQAGILSMDYINGRQSSLLDLEDLTIDIIHRVQDLTRADTPFSRKKKAYYHFVKTLESYGLSHHQAEANKIIQLYSSGGSVTSTIDPNHTTQSSTDAFHLQRVSIPDLFLQSPLTSIFLKSSAQLPLSTSEGYQFIRTIAKHCESYLYRVWSGMKKMRLRTTKAHKDLNASEIHKSRGMLEHLFTMIWSQRRTISLVAVEYHTTNKWLGWIKQLDIDIDETISTHPISSATTPPSPMTIISSSSQTLSWSERFWSHKHLLDSLFASTKYLHLLYTRMLKELTSENRTLHTQLTDALKKATQILLVLSTTKIQLDEKIAALFPNIQLSQTSPSTSHTTAADACLELNDQPNTQFLLTNIEQILKCVTDRDSTDGPDSSLTQPSDEGSIIDLPFVSTTSTFNELVVHLIRSKYEIQQQANHSRLLKGGNAGDATHSLPPTSLDFTTLASSFNHTYRTLVDQLRQSVQDLYKHAQSSQPTTSCTDDNMNEPTHTNLLLTEMKISYICVSGAQLTKINQLLFQLTTILNQMKEVVRRPTDIQSTSNKQYHDFRIALHNLVPLLDQVLLLSERTLGSSINLHRSYLKLSHLLLAILNKILARGFCRKPDEGEDSGEIDEKEGTGMGEGEGKKDVSNQITDEEQLLGTKDEQEKEQEQQPDQSPPEKQPDTDEGVEMENNFEGDMVDVPKEDDDEKEQDDQKDGEEELDREMGDLGDDQNVIDEKLWNDSDDDDQTPEEKEKKRQEEKTERDAPVDGAVVDDEIAAKEEGADDQKRPEPPKDESKPPQPKEAEVEEDQPPPNEDGDEEEEQGGPIQEENEDRFEDKQGPDAMNNLPDDLDLDQDEKDEKEGGPNEDEKEDEDDKMDEDDDGENLDPEQQAKLEEEKAGDPMDEGEDIGEDLQKTELDENPDEDQPDEPQPDEAVNSVEAPESMNEPPPADDAPEDETDEPDVERPDQHAAPDNNDTDQGAHRVTGGDQGHAGVDEEQSEEKKESESNQPKDDHDRSDENVENAADQTVDQANSNDAADGTESEWQPQSTQTNPTQQTTNDSKKKKKRQEKQTPNPFKSLGDANKKWAERLKILDSDESKEDPDTTQLEEDDTDDLDPNSLDGTFENVSADEKADTQMLGPVEQKLDADEMPKIQPENEDTPMEEDTYDQPNPSPKDEEDQTTQPKDDSSTKKESRKRGGTQQLHPTRMTDQPDEDEDEGMEPSEKEKDAALFDPLATDEMEVEPIESRIGQMDDLGTVRQESAPGADPNDPAHQEWLQRLRDELDASIQEWDSSSSLVDAHAHAQHLWHKFTDLTSDLSASLTEHLRMILEPMIATKLKGDYKTGKRINIKKIIPYIASSFRKDKIWLKRTKPNKRHYQVMIAIDDSASMRNNKGGRLALEAMTVLCKSLSALEVGELAVASFGNEVRLLHPFTKPFTDESGAYAVGQFQFTQQFTRWPDLLERTVAILDEAKSIGGSISGASGEHHQLVFIISDARVQQDRATVAKWTREALSKNQLLVLIIVESGPLKDSILSTQSVSYPNGKLTITQYLDDFPFPYYILLRDISSLPEIVADALRQWFELIRTVT